MTGFIYRKKIQDLTITNFILNNIHFMRRRRNIPQMHTWAPPESPSPAPGRFTPVPHWPSRLRRREAVARVPHAHPIHNNISNPPIHPIKILGENWSWDARFSGEHTISRRAHVHALASTSAAVKKPRGTVCVCVAVVVALAALESWEEQRESGG